MREDKELKKEYYSILFKNDGEPTAKNELTIKSFIEAQKIYEEHDKQRKSMENITTKHAFTIFYRYVHKTYNENMKVVYKTKKNDFVFYTNYSKIKLNSFIKL